jgi:pyruvate/2-oxoacid:ferredoxin oxidoreductase beta subunit
MNTGIQRSSATPWGAWTTTTPVNNPKETPKKDIIDILLAHHIPYVATASVAHPDDFIRKMQKAKSIRGMKFIHILSPCPPGWKSLPEESVHISRLAINSKIFPIYEVEDGLNYTINIEPKHTPVEEYLKLQGRFKHLTAEQVKEIQVATDRKWEILMKKVEMGKLFSEN